MPNCPRHGHYSTLEDEEEIVECPRCERDGLLEDDWEDYLEVEEGTVALCLTHGFYSVNEHGFDCPTCE